MEFMRETICMKPFVDRFVTVQFYDYHKYEIVISSPTVTILLRSGKAGNGIFGHFGAADINWDSGIQNCVFWIIAKIKSLLLKQGKFSVSPIYSFIKKRNFDIYLLFDVEKSKF